MMTNEKNEKHSKCVKKQVPESLNSAKSIKWLKLHII